MAGARSKHDEGTTPEPKRPLRRGRSARQGEEIPDVFKDLLAEEEASSRDHAAQHWRPLKKRKLERLSQNRNGNTDRAEKDIRVETSEPMTSFEVPTESGRLPPATPTEAPPTEHIPQDGAEAMRFKSMTPIDRVRQTIIDSDESEESDEEWEDALADGGDSEDEVQDERIGKEIGDISITIGGAKKEQVQSQSKKRRRAITAVDRKRRLDIHKMHLLCLLYHVHRRNAWCNDRRVQSALRRLVSPATLTNLVPNPDISQYQASKRFVDGMNELKMLWSKRFRITKRGMHKARWADTNAEIRPSTDFNDLDDPLDKDDFRNSAHTLQGSQDVGAQLFCALLRGIGIETRLICSLQPLPFASAAQPATPQKQNNIHTITVDPYNGSHNSTTPSRPKKLSRMERIMGERHAVLNKTGVAPKKQKAFHTPFPVYWVEVFNVAHQKWICIDTHSTFTVNAPDKLEPPLNYAQNSLTYAIAFEDDYSARDVTRRYTKAYNAKTRRLRVECTPHGTDWWRRTMQFFNRRTELDRDQIENIALARKEAGEGMPKNVQDFRDHPNYVLERHLKHNEVIHPMNQVGKVNIGSAMNPKIEPIFRRSDVHVVRSADKWYRLGQDVKNGEQPLKHAKPKKGAQALVDPDAIDGQEEVGAGLYAPFQTELYVPPPVIRGRVPRNAFGNLDLYVPSMCPAGGAHIRHKLASKAACIVGVDYAEAVTGFSFKGRHGTAIVQGVVVAQEYADAVQTTVEAMEFSQEETLNAARSRESLRLWRRFFLGLRIAQRVNAIEIDGEKGPTIDYQEEINKEDYAMAEKEMAGGFFPDEGDVVEPSRPMNRAIPRVTDDEPRNHDYDDDVGGGSNRDEAEVDHVPSFQRQFSFESSILDSQQLRPRRKSSFEGGFIPDDYAEHEYEDAGGFLVDNVEEASVSGRQTNHTVNQPTQDRDDEISVIAHEPDITSLAVNEPEASSIRATRKAPALVPEEIAEDTRMESPPMSSAQSSNSLPLEDPDDEDAEPDWLVDAT